MTSALSESLELSDGRHLDVYVSGPEGATPLVLHHGTPGSRVTSRTIERSAHAHGLRVVTMSRPGYGASTRRRGRRVIDVVADTAEVLAWLGVERCVTSGASGGGPHALACAARLPGVAGCLVVAGVAPYDAADLNWLDAMGQDNLDEFAAALDGEDALRRYLGALENDFRHITATEIVDNMSSVLPDVDRAALTGEFADDVARGFREALLTGVDGWLDDDLAFVHSWGFDVAEVITPTMIWQGGLDLMVPYAHGRWLAAALPHAMAHLVDGEGHLSIAQGAIDAMLDELVAVL
ncbi:MAG: alpha/beta hydrolase [Acidobacteria bacterium]|nr:alpha/beta hydrolase [Acidobacteriota bacterium]